MYELRFRDRVETVGEFVTEAVARIGENIRVRRFTRYQLGEAL
jgi:elongation factor Ts